MIEKPNSNKKKKKKKETKDAPNYSKVDLQLARKSRVNVSKFTSGITLFIKHERSVEDTDSPEDEFRRPDRDYLEWQKRFGKRGSTGPQKGGLGFLERSAPWTGKLPERSEGRYSAAATRPATSCSDVNKRTL